MLQLILAALLLLLACVENAVAPFDPAGPCVRCEDLPNEYIVCQEPTEIEACSFGETRFESVPRVRVSCNVLPGIECYGPSPIEECSANTALRSFHKDGVLCVKYSGHYFLSTLLYSVFLGLFGTDRFCLGHSATAIGKLLTLGGLGVWWIVDILLLISGDLMPADGSVWEPVY